MKVILWLTVATTLLAESICGTKHTGPYIEYADVTCADYKALREAGLPVPPTAPDSITQVFIYPKSGDAVKVTVDGKVKTAEIITLRSGKLMAMVYFDGMSNQTISIEVMDVRK